ncbi:hypothetical protein R1sor_015364 [Riccia sorocarpa]|uniref:Reverse transcriptase Ty1/copia-type domain-containing protein n=1 Tax=Riccia sorocarpa TaxID=122646 RepID=A0ABD3HC15_9MARC
MAERMMRTIFEGVRTLLVDAKLERQYWAYAAKFVVWTRNSRDVTFVEDDTSMTQQTFLDPHARGDQQSEDIGITMFLHTSSDVGTQHQNPEAQVHDGLQEDHSGSDSTSGSEDEAAPSSDDIADNSDEEEQLASPHSQQRRDRSNVDPANIVEGRRRRRTPWNEDDDFIRGDFDLPVDVVYRVHAEQHTCEDQKTVPEAMASPLSEDWKKAMDEELNSSREHGTWELALLPHGRKIVGSKWVFRTKLVVDGTVERFKARLVAQGYSQIEGIDYHETFAPIRRLATIRAFVATVATLDWHALQLDVISAYLNGELKEENIYMEVPEGLVVPPQQKQGVTSLEYSEWL